MISFIPVLGGVDDKFERKSASRTHLLLYYIKGLHFASQDTSHISETGDNDRR